MANPTIVANLEYQQSWPTWNADTNNRGQPGTPTPPSWPTWNADTNNRGQPGTPRRQERLAATHKIGQNASDGTSFPYRPPSADHPFFFPPMQLQQTNGDDTFIQYRGNGS